MTTTQVRETATMTSTTPESGTATIALITPGLGSSGVYRAEVLETAAREQVFPAGTQMFINHQTDQEAWAQPEGDLSKLAGVLTENARWDNDQQALVAEAKIYSHWRPILAEMRDDIGVSIRAAAEVSESADGPVIDRITEAVSVDFVTKAGRGGRIVDLIESARNVKEAANIGMWLESRLHTQFTLATNELYGEGKLTRQERISISTALGDALEAFTNRMKADAPQLYSRDPWSHFEAPVAATEASQPPAGKNTFNRKDDTMSTKQIEESEYTALTEKASRADTLEAQLTEAQQQLAAIEAEKTAAERQEHVAGLVSTELEGIDAPTLQKLLIEHFLPEDFEDEDITTQARDIAAEIAPSTVKGLGGNQSAKAEESAPALPTWEELTAIKGA